MAVRYAGGKAVPVKDPRFTGNKPKLETSTYEDTMLIFRGDADDLRQIEQRFKSRFPGIQTQLRENAYFEDELRVFLGAIVRKALTEVGAPMGR